MIHRKAALFGLPYIGRRRTPVKHAVIFAHPSAQSFTASVAAAYTQAVESLGHTAVQRDLYRIGFDPCLKETEVATSRAFQVGDDVLSERKLIVSCDVFALIYPLWLNTPPAMLKGYLDRVFGFGFAYGAGGRSYEPLMGGRQLISFTSSGAPAAWLHQTGSWNALQALFDTYFATLCGMKVVGHVHTGGMNSEASTSFVQARLHDVRAAVMQHFGSSA